MSTSKNVKRITLTPNHSAYPELLAHTLPTSPNLATWGNRNILQQSLLALFGSNQCPARLILRTHDLAQALRQTDTPVIGGFHTPVEQEALTVLLRGPGSLVICPARSLEKMRIPQAWRSSLAEGRLLVLSSFTGPQHRVTAKLAAERNRLVAALSTRVFIAHAAPNSKTEQFCKEVINWGKPVYTFDDPANEYLVEMGVRSVGKDNLAKLLAG